MGDITNPKNPHWNGEGMRVLVVALCLSVVALSGCVAPASGLSLQDEAQREADRTYDDAVLVGILGAEWTNDSLVNQVSEESPEAEALAQQGVDENPGDGLANAWAYFFDSPEGGLVVVVGADGSIVDTEKLGSSSGSKSFGFVNPIGEVSIDSVEAAAIVNENHERFAEVAAAEDALVMMFLVHDDEYFDGTFWAFMAVTAEGEDFVFALVDGTSGEYTDFGSFFG